MMFYGMIVFDEGGNLIFFDFLCRGVIECVCIEVLCSMLWMVLIVVDDCIYLCD